MTNKQNNIPKWFWAIATVILIWNLLGLFAFIQNISTSPASLSEIEQELLLKYPLWTKVVFAIAVFSGMAGSIALLLKKRIAKPLFIISLIAIVIQMGHSVFIAKAMDVYGAGAIALPLFTTLIAAFSIWFSNDSINKNWLA